MRGFYVILKGEPLGEEPLGTDGRAVWTDIKTDAGARARAQRLYGSGFGLYRFTNFYNEETYTKI